MAELSCPRCTEPLNGAQTFYGPCRACREDMRNQFHIQAALRSFLFFMWPGGKNE
jgi:hypothetical protein